MPLHMIKRKNRIRNAHKRNPMASDNDDSADDSRLHAIGARLPTTLPLSLLAPPPRRKAPSPQPVRKNEEFNDYIMISYEWSSQETMLYVKRCLEANGYKVWMDVDQIKGSILEAMAKAVENAAVVLICISQRYKDSKNCKYEAEYAYQQGKQIIPLMMQRNYSPDGWLGMILGANYWHNFYTREAFSRSMEDLVRQLGQKGKR